MFRGKEKFIKIALNAPKMKLDYKDFQLGIPNGKSLGGKNNCLGERKKMGKKLYHSKNDEENCFFF